jgi:tight adherence protein C
LSAAALLGGIAAAVGLLGLLELAREVGGDAPQRLRASWCGKAMQLRQAALRRLPVARRPGDLGLRGWLATKTACAAVAELTILVLAGGLRGRVTFVLAMAAPVAGFLGPDAWLARVAKRRTESAVRDLPDMLDLFRVTVEAGMAPARALGVVGGEFNGPLASEWKRLAAEVELGVAQDEALAALGKRMPAEEITLFVELLTRGRRHGVPLGQLLAAQASRARRRRAERVRQRAARAGPNIQLVVALLLVPAVLLLIAAGLVAELERSGLLLAT